MTSWSTPTLLLIGIALGPHGLRLLSTSTIELLDPGLAMALAMIGVFVGLNIDLRPRYLPGHLLAAVFRTSTAVVVVGAAAFSASAFWLGSAATMWLPPVMFGLCAAVSEVSSDLNLDDVLIILAGGLILSTVRLPVPGTVFLLSAALAGISTIIALAVWIFVGQTSSEGEQHVFVVGSLLLVGGAAAYLSLSAVFAGLFAGVAWNLASNIGKARILRDLRYFQHPPIVLALVAAGATAGVSIEAIAIGLIFVVMRTLARPLGAWIARRFSPPRLRAEEDTPLMAAGLVGIGLALDAFRVGGHIQFTSTFLGAIVIGTILAEALALFHHRPEPA